MAKRTSTTKVGIALSSGGAAGLAHVGVLEELTRAGIPVHCVVGTSAGALVGAAFAAGRLAALRDTMCGLTRRRVLALFDPTWPSVGLLEGRRSLELIRPHVGERIEALPLPFAAIATDLASGTEVVLREGSVIEAIRASLAIPGLFKPQPWGERLLVDGGLVNPLPVDVARQMGADFVIAVSVLRLPHDSPLPTRGGKSLTAQLLARFLASQDGLAATRGDRDAAGPFVRRRGRARSGTGLFDVLSAATGIAQARIAHGRLRDHPPDCLIAAPQPEMGLFDFHRAPAAIEVGRAAARRALPEIRKALVAAGPFYRRVSGWLDASGPRARRRSGTRRRSPG